MPATKRTASPAPKAAASSKETEQKEQEVKDEKDVKNPSLERTGSVYALEPNRRWLRPSWAFPLFGSAWLLSLLLCLILEPSFEMLRLYYTFVAAGLLLYRVYYYARKEWILYFIDICFVNSIFLLWSLWSCTENRCSHEWLTAVYMVSQGPVGGATFPLQTPVTLHHPEGFESFFMHASPMWISYAVRWRWPSVLGPTPAFTELVRLAFVRLYGPWAICYTMFLLMQPLFPDKIAGYETLLDGFLFPSFTAEQRREAKRQGFKTYARRVVTGVAMHSCLSLSGVAAAALAYQYHSVQVVWIGCVLLGCLFSGYNFYYRSANPQAEAPPLSVGFKRMLCAWACVLPTYLVSAGYVW
eukprot:TRINITY_DN22887_c0_g1_i2.p1 TRINITY_DN22887_c0_g1~~TRINITY_DN22887_c0_g1_i2.p1  ORF type:complete len:374 (-),score=52.43 TRINITY_DN22887_c0_g1_i2:276-1343(-)